MKQYQNRFLALAVWYLAVALLAVILLLIGSEIAQGQERETWLATALSNDAAADARIIARNLRLEAGDTLGDSKMPGVMISAWDKECFLKMGLRTGIISTLQRPAPILVNGYPGVRIVQ
ncbi:MAG: hypothetical protein AB1690_02405, partial [Candidatus Zixiibacteriota bacterium]